MIVEARFIKSASNIKEALNEDLLEVAFLGRSNVGKSSLINALTGQKNLAKKSATPGKTRLINFFELTFSLSLDDALNFGLDLKKLNLLNSQEGLHSKIINLNEAINSSSKLSKTVSAKLASSKITSLNENLKLNSKDTVNLKIDEAVNLRTDELVNSKENSSKEPSLNANSRPNSKETVNLNSNKTVNLNLNSNQTLASLSSLNEKKMRLKKIASSKSSCNLEEKGLKFTPTLNGELNQAKLNLKLNSKEYKNIRFKLGFVDLPGFGYARISKEIQKNWARNLDEFLRSRSSIRLFLHLIDSRHENLELDCEINKYLNSVKTKDQKISKIFTKADKLNQSQRTRLKDECLVSATTKQGLKELKVHIIKQVLGS